eukprot:UN28050
MSDGRKVDHEADHSKNMQLRPGNIKAPEGWKRAKYTDLNNKEQLEEGFLGEKLLYHKRYLDKNLKYKDELKHQLGPRDIGRVDSEQWHRYKTESPETKHKKQKQPNINPNLII